MKKVVIVGSASLQEPCLYWKSIWEEKGYIVTNYPIPIDQTRFQELYPQVHTTFFKDITEADILFIMNEDKKGIEGYLGAESFAELCFGVAQNLLHHQNLEIILLKQPSQAVQSYEEIVLWLQLGWIKLYS